ncbi:MAG: hypothetical protein RLP14_05080 [Owenweeksia sp.]
MKKVVLGMLLCAVVVLGINASVNKTQAEEYAVVNVVEKSTRLIIRTTISGQETKAVNLSLDRLDGEDMVEFKPVIEELSRLNSMGFELVNGSTTSMTYGSVKHNPARPYHSFIFKKVR